jgi:hypothetical protein
MNSNGTKRYRLWECNVTEYPPDEVRLLSIEVQHSVFANFTATVTRTKEKGILVSLRIPSEDGYNVKELRAIEEVVSTVRDVLEHKYLAEVVAAAAPSPNSDKPAPAPAPEIRELPDAEEPDFWELSIREEDYDKAVTLTGAATLGATKLLVRNNELNQARHALKGGGITVFSEMASTVTEEDMWPENGV